MTGAVATFLGLNVEAQRKQQAPSIEFGRAQVSLGMTVEQVQKSLTESARHIEFMTDKHTALVRVNNAPVPTGDEGQVTFFDGRVVYAAFQFPATHDAVELAQEVAGAVENMGAKTCTLANYTSHGTGGGGFRDHFRLRFKKFQCHDRRNAGNQRPLYPRWR